MKKNENAHSVSSLLIDINTKCQYGNSEKTTREAKGDAVVRAIARPPVLWPGLQILASTRYVSGSLPCSKTYSFCRFSDFPFSLKTDTQHSMWKAWARLHKFFTTSKCFLAKKKIPIYNFIYDRHYGWIVLESLSDETKQRKFHLKNSKSQPPSTTLLS